MNACVVSASINDGPRSLTGINAKIGGVLDSALCDGSAFAIGASR
jgi:hypothetical protein